MNRIGLRPSQVFIDRPFMYFITTVRKNSTAGEIEYILPIFSGILTDFAV